MSCEFRFDNFVEELGLTIEAWDEMIKTGQVPKPDSNTLQTPQILEDVHPFTSTVEQSPPVGRKPTDEMNSSLIQDVESSTVEQSPPVGRKPTDEMNSSLIQDVESSTVEQSPPVANKPDDVMDSSLIQAAVPTHSTSKDSLSCEKCGKSFTVKRNLTRHQKICGNTDSKTFSCTHCLKAFSRKEHLENHLKTHEKNKNENSSTSNLNCSICEKTFSKQANLKRHMLSHNEEKKSFKCPLCNIEFTRADNLTVHLRSHVNLNYPCTTCHAKFNSKFNLKQHMQSQHTSLSHESRKRKVSVKNSSSKKQKTYAEALNVFSSTFLTPNEDERFDIDVLVEKRGADLRRMIEDKLDTHRGVKWQILAKCLFERKTPEGELQAISTYFRSSNYTELTNDTINEHIYEAFEKIKKLIDEFVNLGSGWIFQRIQHIEVKIADYHPLAPSSHIKSPEFLEKKKAVLNIENYNDSKCLIWCLIAHQLKLDFKQHPKRLSHYTPLEHTIKLDNISCPVPVKSIPKIENLNNLRINVFGLDDQEVYPLYVSPKEDADVINLLVLEKDEQFHYTLIRSFSRLLGNVTKHRAAAYYCYRCLHRFCRQDLLTSHTEFCKQHSAQRINLPKFGEHILSFTGTHLQHPIPFIVYADFESILKPMTPASQTSHCEKISKHEACSFAFVIIDSEGKPYKNRFTLYRGENAAEEFLKKLISETDDIREKLQSVKPMQLSPQQEIEFKSATHCHICKRELFSRRTRDHDHVTGAYRGAAHVGCNINYKQSRSIPVVFHNLRHYDAHHIMMSIGKFKEYSIEVIASTLETYIGFRMVKKNCPIHLNFIDSLQHLSASLEKLTNNLQQDEFKILKHHFKNQDISLLTRKGVYPYDYITDVMKFDETALPPTSAFTNTLTDKPIKNEDYQHALNVWKTFNLQTLGDYHDLYLKTDVLLLADAFQSYRKLCQQFYDIDSAHMYTLPSLAWQACLKKTNIQLELLTDIDMLLMFENGIRGGISMISQRYAKANIPNTPAYNKDQAPSYIMYWDANNLYGWAMSEYLPHGSFQWEDPKKFTSNSILKLADDSSTGYIFEVDLDYPKELHALHNEYPLAPERLTVEEEMLSPFAKKMLENRKIKDTPKLISNLEDKKNKKLENRKFKGTPKLIPNLQNKKNYIVHYRTLKFYIQSGMILTQIHRVIQFEQSPWIREYIAFNTEKRKQAKSEFEKDFFKLLNNAVYGKTLENLRKRRNVELCNTERRAKKLVASPAFKTFKIFSEDLVAVERTKLSLLINRPLYVGFCILELSKLLMYQFHYGFVKETYQQNARLLFTDTDSLCYQIFTKDIIADMQEKKDLFDFSDYPQSHPLFSTVNKKVLGKFTDELSGELALEFVGLKAKMYSLLSETEVKKRAKGITTHIVRNKLKHEDYLECLQQLKSNTVTQVRIGQENHQLYTMQQNKVGLSPFDDKRYILEDGITSLAYGHCDIKKM